MLCKVTFVVKLCAALEQHTCKVRVVEFEMSLVVELEKRGGVGVVVFQVKVVYLRLRGGVATILAHIHLNKEVLGMRLEFGDSSHLRSPLFVVVLVGHAVNLEAVALQ